MRWKHTPRPVGYDEWRSWFAWYPVVVGDEYVWLEWVERRQSDREGTWDGLEWDYRARLRGNA